MFKSFIKCVGKAPLLLGLCLAALIPFINIAAKNTNDMYVSDDQSKNDDASAIPAFLDFDSPEPYSYTVSIMGRDIMLDLESVAERIDSIGRSIFSTGAGQ
jgi:hypothetical protein